MKNPNYITNPKTKRKYERSFSLYNGRKEFAEKNGYKVASWFTNSWSFSKDGVKSVLAFETEMDCLQFIFDNSPDPKKIFPPYRFTDEVF